MTKVIINEQHAIMEEQDALIRRKLGNLELVDNPNMTPMVNNQGIVGNYEVVKIPSEGLNRQEIEKLTEQLIQDAIIRGDDIVVMSPIPLLLAKLTAEIAKYNAEYEDAMTGGIYIMHNDRREKKELPDGRVLSVIASTGWELIEIA